MGKVLITQELVDIVLNSLVSDTPFPKESIYWELQDGFQSLFISIPIDAFTEPELTPAIKRVAKILNDAVPKRDDDYSWVVGFKKAGEVVDSCFGGSLTAPSSGL